jgi:deoxyadenosine kinase
MSDKKVETYTKTFSPNNTIISVSGIIGVGKSTLSKKLGEYYKADVYYEPVETNEYLSKFYKNMKKYSFPMQIYLLNHRFRQHQQMAWSTKNIVQDRSIYEDVIFAKMLREDGLMDELDFQTYRSLYQNMSNFLHRPDIIVYLDVKPEIAMERIKKRARGCETGLSVGYLQSLQKGYEDWLEDISPRIPVIRVDWNTFRDTEDITKLINEKLKNKKGLII